MKYMSLIYQNPATWRDLPEPDRQAIMSDAGALMAELTGSGEWVGGEALADPSTAKAVRVRDGVPAVTDGLLGPYQLQAAIAAVHAEARDAEETDWRQILALYDLLERVAPSPVVTLESRAARLAGHG